MSSLPEHLEETYYLIVKTDKCMVWYRQKFLSHLVL